MAQCALCSAEPATETPVAATDHVIALCADCRAGVENGPTDHPRWHCLTEAIWSTEAPVQITAYRLLKALPQAPWARETLEMAYLEPEVLAAAEADLSTEPDIVHHDSNGAVLSVGDTVVLIKDLPVKGAGFTAKRGTAVRNIALVPDNPEQIEGRVEGQRIVILTKFVKKS
ncbi:alkylphosphonate utilization protein [Actibacterium ureilyticum]|uniref:alkylphosphonate utilization protein n=1 Tax=Actibacterium ureilyticum TaxID=1590614 RepID=UPI000BAB0963|nr:alkylphosphonate utilization protein [Actibacterium ureilyticum]